MPDGLVHVPVHGNDKMVREYGIWVDKNMILLSLAPVELHQYLFGRTVLAAEEAFPPGYILLVQFRS